jgi:transcriptional regulator with XRE-family HTH domain
MPPGGSRTTEDPRTDVPIAEALPEILRDRDLSLRTLAATIGMSASHLSRALRGKGGRHLSLAAVEAIAAVVELPPSYFREYRTELAVAGVRADIALADRVFDSLKRT